MNTTHSKSSSLANKKAEIKKLMDKILVVTMKFKDEFPEVYKNFEEIPMLDFSYNTKLNPNDFKQYLNTITCQLEIIKKSKFKTCS